MNDDKLQPLYHQLSDVIREAHAQADHKRYRFVGALGVPR